MLTHFVFPVIFCFPDNIHVAKVANFQIRSNYFANYFS